MKKYEDFKELDEKRKIEDHKKYSKLAGTKEKDSFFQALFRFIL